MTARCHPCWLPGSHTLDEHMDRAATVTLLDLAPYGVTPPPRPVEATLVG
jgi:hypothetical protein